METNTSNTCVEFPCRLWHFRPYKIVLQAGGAKASSNKSFCSKDSKGDHADDRGNQKGSQNPMHIEFWGFKIAKIYMNYFLLQIHLTNVRKQGLSKETGFHNLTTICSTRGGSL